MYDMTRDSQLLGEQKHGTASKSNHKQRRYATYFVKYAVVLVRQYYAHLDHKTVFATATWSPREISHRRVTMTHGLGPTSDPQPEGRDAHIDTKPMVVTRKFKHVRQGWSGFGLARS